MRKKLTTKLVATLKPEESRYEVADTEIEGLSIRVEPSGRKTYCLRYRTTSGQRERLRLGSDLTIEQARDMARKEAAKAELGQNPQAERKMRRTLHTLGEFVELEYAPWVKANRKSGKATVARLEKQFKFLYECKLNSITVKQVESWQTKRIRDGKTASTANRDLTLLKAVLSKAVEYGHISENPINRAKRLKEDSQPMVRYVTHEEFDRLLKALDDREERLRVERDNHIAWQIKRGYEPSPSLRGVAFADYLKPMIVLSVVTGVRRSELFSLEWPFANLETKLLSVKGSLSKSGNTRHIPLNLTAMETLRGWKAQSPSGGVGLVFPSEDGKRFNNVDTALTAVLKQAEIKDVTWHTFRHTTASWLVQAGVPIYEVQKVLGHHSLKTTERYAHLSPTVRAAGMERIAIVTPANVMPLKQTQRA